MAYRSPTLSGLSVPPNAVVSGSNPVAAPDEMDGHTWWGRWAAADELPNATSAPASAAAYNALRPGDLAFAQDQGGLMELLDRGTDGGGDAIWVRLGAESSVLRTMGAPSTTDNILTLTEILCISVTRPIASGGTHWRATLWLNIEPDSSSAGCEIVYAFPGWVPVGVTEVRGVASAMAQNGGASQEEMPAALVTEGADIVIKIRAPFQPEIQLMIDFTFTAP